MNREDAIWLFDGVCMLCSQGVQYTLKHEKSPTIRFVAIQSDEGRRLAERFGVDADDPETFLFIENGEALEKSDGVLALVKHLQGPASVLSFGRFLPRGFRDSIYELVARNRYRLFGRKDVCMVPNAEDRHRFVLPGPIS